MACEVLLAPGSMDSYYCFHSSLNFVYMRNYLTHETRR